MEFERLVLITSMLVSLCIYVVVSMYSKYSWKEINIQMVQLNKNNYIRVNVYINTVIKQVISGLVPTWYTQTGYVRFRLSK